MRSVISMIRVAIVMSFVVSASALAQSAREPVHLDAVAKIKEEGLKRSKAMETVSYLTDVHGPRLTGSPLTRRAGEWTKKQLTDWGLENVRFETWGPFGRGWSLEGFTANMLQPSFSPLIAFPKAWSPSTQKTVRGTPIYLDASSQADLDKYRGKLHRAIVLISPPREVKALFDAPARRQTDEALLALANADVSAPRGGRAGPPGDATAANAPAGAGRGNNSNNSDRNSMQLLSWKWQLAYSEGAAVVLEPGRGDGGTLFVGAATLPQRGGGGGRGAAPNRRPNPWSNDAPELLPQAVVAVEHYNRLVRMLEKGIPVELEVDIASRLHEEDAMSFNILAEIPGSDLKDEIVMLGGHFDSWHSGTGATDNAVGCAVALEAARILKAINLQPRRTIRLALWTGEEQGLLGSRAYVAEHFGRSVTTPQESGNPANNPPAAKPDTAKPDTAGTDATANSTEQPAAKNGKPTPRRIATKYELKPDHAKFSAYFNLDNGTGKIRGIYLQSNEQVRSIFRAWLAPFADMGASTVTQTNTSGTDHLSFDGIGLPGFQFIQDPLEYNSRTHHSSMDVYERVQEDDVKQAAIIMASFVYHAAMRDEKLPRKPLNGEVINSADAEPSAAKPR